MSITLASVTKRYRSRAHETVALDQVSLALDSGEIGVIVGPSGSGKTSVLRCIAGLEALDAGTITVNGRDVTAVAPGERDVAMVFQDHGLYPHLRVRANIGFALRARKTPNAETQRRTDAALEMLGIAHLAERLPHELSGGERQRVALARAAVREPAVFLLDEPLSALDPARRAQARAELRALQRRLGTTMLYVTHDHAEAMSLGDRVIVLVDGRVLQSGSPREVYEHPESCDVARIFGSPPINLVGAAAFVAGLRRDHDDAERIEARVPATAHTVGLRPERVAIVDGDAGLMRGVVQNIDVMGSDQLVTVAVGETEITARAAADRPVRIGDVIGLAANEADLRWFDATGAAVR